MKKTLLFAILLSAFLLYLGRNELLVSSGRRAPSAAATEKSALLHPPSGLDRVRSEAGSRGILPIEVDSIIDIPSPSRSMILRKGTIGRRSSFFEEMRRSGVSPAEIERIVRATRGTFNLRKVRPGQEYTVYSSSPGFVDSIYYRMDHEKFLRIKKVDGRFTAVVDTVAYRIIYKLTHGTIRQSLFASLQKEGAETELAGSLALIFGWVIDFFKDIRSGDTYTILYEKKEYEDGYSTLGRIIAARVVTRGKPYYAFRFKTGKGKTGYYDLEGKSLQKTLLRAPLKFTRITSSFRSKRLHPVTHTYRPHLGVDYAAPYGTPVHATGDGTVMTATRNRANGKYIKIRHNRSYITYYLHLSRFAKGIARGKRVRQGQVIGYVGSTGLATGPHLDYRIKVNGRFVNPRTIRLPSKSPVPRSDLALFRKTRDAALRRFLEIRDVKNGATVVVGKPFYPGSMRMEIPF